MSNDEAEKQTDLRITVDFAIYHQMKFICDSFQEELNRRTETMEHWYRKRIVNLERVVDQQRERIGRLLEKERHGK